MNSNDASAWQRATLAAAVFAVDPHALGGINVRSAPGPIRDLWLEELALLLDPRKLRRIPLHVSEARLLGGIDLAATLQHGALHSEQGLLAQCDGHVALLAMAERAERRVVAHLCTALDSGAISTARTGAENQAPARFGVVALDEGLADEGIHPALAERMALEVQLDGIALAALSAASTDVTAIEHARMHWRQIDITEEQLAGLGATALALGIASLRATFHAVTVARILAALDGDDRVTDEHLMLSVAMVLAHRATQLPATDELPEDANQEPPPEPPPTDEQHDNPPDEPPPEDSQQPPLTEQLTEAAVTALPRGLLKMLRSGSANAERRSSANAGKAGEHRRHRQRGRPIGIGEGDPRQGDRLNLLGTLRAAAPWQKLRQGASTTEQPPRAALQVRKQDFRVTRFRHQRESATLFVVDASGSAAMHRMAEAKGAVELLLADCYVRRDSVALIAFRGDRAELLLPPTRSLVRAKRTLAALPGGGGTPLASAIELTERVADQLARQGCTPTAVFLTDGVANIARDGRQGRAAAKEDVEAAARSFRMRGLRALVIDSSPRAQPKARELADALGSQYLAMPSANARGLHDAVAVSQLLGS